MLEREKLTVSEVAYATGFTNPSWFSKAFKKLYGVSPAHYKTEENT